MCASSGPNVVVRVDEDMLNRWDKYCQENKISRSELIRSAVNERIDGANDELLNRFDELIFYYFNSLKQQINQKVG